MKILTKENIFWSLFILLFTYIIPAFFIIFIIKSSGLISIPIISLFVSTIYVYFRKPKIIDIIKTFSLNFFLIFITRTILAMAFERFLMGNIPTELYSKLEEFYLTAYLISWFAIGPLFLIMSIILSLIKKKY